MSKTLGERSTAIRSLLSSKERFADMLSLIGYEVSRDFKFSMREERTPSIVIYNTGTAYDFGEGGKRLDIIDIIVDKEGLSFKDAIVKAEDLLGIDNKGKSSYEFKAPVFVNSKGSSDAEYDDTPLKESYISYFRTCLNANKQKADKHLSKLLPNATPEQKKEMVIKFEMGYDPKTDKITFPVRSVKGHIMNMAKYTSEPGRDDKDKEVPKLKYLYGRRRVLFNLEVLKNAPKTVLVLEGEKDVFNATLNGTPAITQGAASGWKSWMADSIKKGCEFYKVDIPQFIILQDNDKPGIKSTLRIFKDLKEIQPKTRMMFWEKQTAESLIKIDKMKPYIDNISLCKMPTDLPIPKGFDYTDYKSQCV